jgi:PAS domain S-box-containing protein
LLKAITAFASLATAVLLAPLIPLALALPNPAQLEATALSLKNEITERKKAEGLLQRVNEELEDRVAQRTASLALTNSSLQAEISDRFRAEEALRQSEERLRLVLQNMPVMLDALDIEGNLIIWNQECSRVTGYSAAEIIGNSTAMELLYPNTAYRQQMIAQWAEQGNCYRNWEWDVTCKDGSIKTIAWSNLSKEFPIPGWASWGIGIDITDRKQAEEALRQANQELENRVAQRTAELAQTNKLLQQELLERERSQHILQEQAQLLDLAHDTILTLSLDGVITFWNRGAEQRYGFPKSEALGKVSHELLHTQFPQALADIQAELFNQGYWEGELIHTSQNGIKFTVASRWALQRDKDGIPIKILEINNDISERKKVEEALKASEHALIEAQHLANLGNWSFDVVTQEVTWSDETFRIFGLDPTQPELTYEQHLQIIHPDDVELFERNAELAITEGRAYEHEIRIFRPDSAAVAMPGTSSSMRYTLGRGRAVLNEQGQVVKLFGTVQDISDRKLAESALQQAKVAAEAANQAKSIFLANMSHELRTPLNAILGFSQLMNRDTNLSPEQQEDLSIITRSGEHLLTLINQVLDLAKIEAGRITLNETAFDLIRLLDDLEDIFQLKAQEKGLHLIFERCDDVPQYVCADEVKLRQVLMNLLSNAIKFTSDGGVSLRVASRKPKGVSTPSSEAEQPTSEREQLTLYFEIEDTGPGIAPDELDKLFQAFVQTQTGFASQQGTGLGLIISRQFVKLMGGEITVSSSLGRGTIFKFDIHLGVADAPAIKTKPSTRRVIALQPNQPSYRLLIVDDRWDNRQLLIKLLNPLGFEIKEATNGIEAIELWSNWEPHLIFMDMRMPVMDGYEATKRIKATTQGQATAIVALSASNFGEARAVVFSVGCDDFIHKPFREADIFDALHKHIGVRYVYDEAAREPNATPTQALTPEAIAALPADCLASLQKAAIEGDLDLILSQIEQIPSQNDALANALASLAKKFQFKQLLTLLQPKMN